MSETSTTRTTGTNGRAPVGPSAPESSPDRVADHVRGLVGELEPDLVTLRRDLHAHPELGNAEVRTTQVIVDTMRSVGLTARVLTMGTGATVDVLPDGWRPGDRLTGLRADIDALPIADAKTVPYASTVPDLCHACGHDVHTTVLVGTGLVLARLRDRNLLTHGVRLIFQPAEEQSPGGAVDAIACGVLEDVTEVYALHCDPRTDVGQVGTRTGPITSACDRVRIRASGPGGHTSRPHLTADLVGALAALATQLPLLLSRTVDPRGGVSLIWGRIRSGTAANAIPERGELEGTLRAMNVAGWETAGAALPELCRQVAAPYGVELEIEVSTGVPPTVNHPRGVERIAAAVQTMVGPRALVDTEQSLGGEDFSWMLQRVPGAMARLGVRTPGQPTADIHRPTFDVDERCIAVGVRLMTGLALLDD